jgi:hypothetical protein
VRTSEATVRTDQVTVPTDELTMQLLERLHAQESEGPRTPEPRLASAAHVFVAMVVCLGLWTVLAGPILERNASAGPVGVRRTAALAVLRPFVAVADALRLSNATGSFERALGHDPQAQPGGALELPELELPPAPIVPVEYLPRPSVRPDASTEPTPAAEVAGPATGEPPAPDGIRIPTPSNKLRVAVIGDSLSQGLGPAIERWMDPDLVRVLSLGRQSTGLSRQDYFNWQAGMRQIVEQFRPDLVFVMLGSNDAQPQISPGGAEIPVGSVEWVQAYRDRARRLIGEATRAGIPVVWVGIPVVEERWRWDFYRRANGIFRDAVEADPLGLYVDTWSAFEAKDGGYTAYLRSERGVLQEVRAPDGIHFTPTGYAYLGRLAIREAAEAFGLAQGAVAFRL